MRRERELAVSRKRIARLRWLKLLPAKPLLEYTETAAARKRWRAHRCRMSSDGLPLITCCAASEHRKEVKDDPASTPPNELRLLTPAQYIDERSLLK